MRPFVRVNRLLLAAFAVLAVIPAGSVQAQAPAGSFGDYKMDAKKPVDIQADWLEVDDKKQVATFRGNVIAKQGDYTIRASELTVAYSSAQAKKNAPPATADAGKPPAKSPGEPNADIKYIEAKGNVVVSSTRDNQSARANNGHFDVKAQTITLFDDVVVSKDKNVIKGEKLLIELALGKSTFLSSDATAAVVDPNAPKQRLRMIITPQSAATGAANPKKLENPGASQWLPAAPQ
jgi:lipopolysaccharide export system protein LptA